MQKNNNQEKINKSNAVSKAAYISYNFKRFFTKPFGYVIAILYIVYLAVILIIVPKSQNFDPLIIWNIGGFNIPILNLLFISAAAASMVTVVFRTGRDDGSDLVFSSKPLTKSQTVWIKTLVFICLMLSLCILSLFITLLVLPIFGEYNVLTNPKGITLDDYKGLILSVLIGNIVNLLFFGSIATFISMFGKQIITMIITIGLSVVLLIINFLTPIITTSPLSVLSQKYNSEIYSFSCNTLSQFNKTESPVSSFAAIGCSTDDYGVENPQTHFDTNTYWKKAVQESNSSSSNYFDFGKQLSSLFSSFGLDNAKLKEASKLSIGVNNNFIYTIDENTCVANQLETGDYPICIYTLTEKRGKIFPKVMLIAGDMNLSSDNWFAYSKLMGLEFDSISYAKVDSKEVLDPYVVLKTKPTHKMCELLLTDGQMESAINLYNECYLQYESLFFKQKKLSEIMLKAISQDKSNQFFPTGTFEQLSLAEKFNIVSKIHFFFAILAFQEQVYEIKKYNSSKGNDVSFPFKSIDVINYFKSSASEPVQQNYLLEQYHQSIFQDSISISSSIPDFPSTTVSDKLITSTLEYAETYSNLYKYSVRQAYSVWTILAIWSSLSVVLFSTAIIVYRKTDFK